MQREVPGRSIRIDTLWSPPPPLPPWEWSTMSTSEWYWAWESTNPTPSEAPSGGTRPVTIRIRNKIKGLNRVLGCEGEGRGILVGLGWVMFVDMLYLQIEFL